MANAITRMGSAIGKRIAKVFTVPTQDKPITRPQTIRYRPNQFFLQARDLPPFTFETIRVMLQDPAIKLNLAMRAAPIASVEFAYVDGVGADGKPKWTPGIKARNPVVAAYIQRQLTTIWNSYLPGILVSQNWGWAAGEVTLKLTHAGMIEIDKLLPRHAKDCRLLECDSTGEPWGVQVQNLTDVGKLDLPYPYCYFVNFRPENGEKYSSSVLLGAYSPWADKWLNGGALDTRRLYMHKDAYGGMKIAYPEEDLYVDGNPNAVPARDVAMQIAEQRQAGGTITYPSTTVEGAPKWKIEEATVSSNPAHILQYPKDLDDEMRQGLEIPDGAINNDGSGAWEGKTLPLAAMYAGLDTWVTQICIDLRRTLDPLVEMNFGPGQEYEICHKPLALQAMEQQGEKRQGGPPEDDQTYSRVQADMYRMSTVPGDKQEQSQVSAEAIAKELRRQARNRAAARKAIQRMALIEQAPNACCELEALPLKPPKEFSCALFPLPPDIAEEVRSLAMLIHPDDLSGNGIEQDPHVTIKYGLHADSLTDEISSIAKQSGPVTIQLGDTSTFENGEYDVVKIEVISEELRSLNAELSKLPCTDTFPEYLPHITLAYVLPGLGSIYAEKLNALKGRSIVFDRMTFSDKQSVHTSIMMGVETQDTEPSTN